MSAPWDSCHAGNGAKCEHFFKNLSIIFVQFKLRSQIKNPSGVTPAGRRKLDLDAALSKPVWVWEAERWDHIAAYNKS